MGTAGEMASGVGPTESSDLPGDVRSWREFRAALKKLMARAEVTAVAVERMSAEPELRAMGVETIGDATVGRKLADNDRPVDARSVRTIVVACAVTVRRRGEDLPDADLQSWLTARTRLAEDSAPSTAGPAVDPAADPAVGKAVGDAAETAAADTGHQRRRYPGAALAVLLAVAIVAGLSAWTALRPDRPTGPVPSPSASTGTAADELTSGQPPCRNPPDVASGTGLTIAEPVPGTLLLGDATLTRGAVSLGPDERPPWLMLYAVGECRFYLVAPVMVEDGRWSGTLYVDPTQHGTFVAYVVVVGARYDAKLHAIAAESRSPYIVRLPPGARTVHVTVRCCA